MRNVYIVALPTPPLTSPFLPYIYGLLRASAEDDPQVTEAYDFRSPFFLQTKADKVVAALQEPAVVGLSCYVWNFRQHMKIARLCKARYPKTLVVAGGPHIPNDGGAFFSKHPYVDLLVHGEGELAFRAILRQNLSAAPDWSAIPGVSYLDGDATITVPRERLLVQEFSTSPYLGGYLDRSISICRALGLPVWAPWETNRGCPYVCAFCDWGSATMSRIRTFDLERLSAR